MVIKTGYSPEKTQGCGLPHHAQLQRNHQTIRITDSAGSEQSIWDFWSIYTLMVRQAAPYILPPTMNMALAY
ncbi:MAG: hypothetical protein ABW170_09195 [Candidatus Thiodiazotropha sp. L084R]